MQAKTHLDGLVHSVELAAIGRRTAETELELLDARRSESVMTAGAGAG